MIVTDIIRQKGNKKVRGFYMDGFLKENLDIIPDKILPKDFDAVLIVSGSGDVRVGKSTIGAQIGSYLAWRIAGGIQETERDSKGKLVIKKFEPPKKDINFSLNNMCFSPSELMKKAKAFPEHSVLIYDEGRAGLDSKRAMDTINKTMENFFQTCGMYGHVIIIVLPNFFKLHEDFAVIRSIFLIDVYTKELTKRGFFRAYNRGQKEYLYYVGKRKYLTTSQRYRSTYPSFMGKFTSWFPFDREEYIKRKKEAINKQEVEKSKKFMAQRDALFYLLQKFSILDPPTIAKMQFGLSGYPFSANTIPEVIIQQNSLLSSRPKFVRDYFLKMEMLHPVKKIHEKKISGADGSEEVKNKQPKTKNQPPIP